MVSEVYINLPVKDLLKSVAFFTKLGFKFDPRFTDEKGSAMILGKNNYCMLLAEDFFKSFTKLEIPDTKGAIEVINALSVASREEVDNMVDGAVKAGGKEPRGPMVEGEWMYNRSFSDLDGHLWEAVYMDMSKFPGSVKK